MNSVEEVREASSDLGESALKQIAFFAAQYLNSLSIAALLAKSEISPAGRVVLPLTEVTSLTSGAVKVELVLKA